jgi:hypothetical protein
LKGIDSGSRTAELTRASTKEPVAADRAVREHLQLGEYRPSCFGQVPPHGDHGLLVILCAFDPLIQLHHMSSGKPALVDHH